MRHEPGPHVVLQLTHPPHAQAHHDYCEHDDIPIAVENGFHDLEEAKCHECSMSRKHIAGLPNCPEVDCEDPGVLTMAYDALKTTAGCTDAENGCCSNDAEKGAWKVMMAVRVSPAPPCLVAAAPLLLAPPTSERPHIFLSKSGLLAPRANSCTISPFWG